MVSVASAADRSGRFAHVPPGKKFMSTKIFVRRFCRIRPIAQCIAVLMVIGRCWSIVFSGVFGSKCSSASTMAGSHVFPLKRSLAYCLRRSPVVCVMSCFMSLRGQSDRAVSSEGVAMASFHSSGVIGSEIAWIRVRSCCCL